MGGRRLVVQSLARFDSQDAAVPVDGKLGKRQGLIKYKATQLAAFRVTVNTVFNLTVDT